MQERGHIMTINKYTGKEEYVEYEDGTRILLDADDSPVFTDKEWEAAPRVVLPQEIIAAFKRTRGRPPLESPKKHIGMRLDADVVDWLRSHAGYNVLVNNALRQQMQVERL
jgi:uncharacterized protein (DUF4415 family)